VARHEGHDRDPGGDLRAVAGTVAEVSVETDRPLRSGVVELDNGNKINLEGSGTSLTVKIPIEKDGIYHFSAIEQGRACAFRKIISSRRAWIIRPRCTS
jgi:hypothetical protein